MHAGVIWNQSILISGWRDPLPIEGSCCSEYIHRQKSLHKQNFNALDGVLKISSDSNISKLALIICVPRPPLVHAGLPY